MDGSASKHRLATCARAGELIEQLQGGIRELPAGAEDAGRLPREIARREDLKRKLEEARERLEREARQRAEAGRAGYERKVQAREARNGAGRAPQPPSEEPDPRRQSNLTDPESALMRENAQAEFPQGYNARRRRTRTACTGFPGRA